SASARWCGSAPRTAATCRGSERSTLITPITMSGTSTQHFNSAQDRAAYTAARAMCRRAARELFFASHFLAREQRHALYVIHAVLGQLHEIVHHPGTAEQPAETFEQKRAVCGSVLEHLWAGEATGKPELDGFHAVVT